MKRILFVSMLSILSISGCDKNDDAYIGSETITIGSEKRLASWGTEYIPTMCVKQEGDTEWHRFYHHIEGFTFEGGYECTLRVKIFEVKIQLGTDMPNRRYIMTKLISKVKKDSEGLPEDIPYPYTT